MSTGWLRHEAQSDDERRHAEAHELGVPFVTFDRHEVDLDALLHIPEPLARAHNMLAYRAHDGAVEVAMLDLAALDVLEPLRPRMPKILPRLTTEESLKKGLLRYQQLLKEKFGPALAQVRHPAQLMRGLLSHALSSGASSIHIDPTEQGLRVRYRIGGALYEGLLLPKEAHRGLSQALPVSGSGTIDLGHADHAHVRVHTAPGAHGTKIVIHAARGERSLESLGLHGDGLERLYRTLARRNGLVLVSGMGKTTLVSALRAVVDTMHVAVAAPQDAVSLRAALRTDPDIIVMEAADRESCKLLTAAATRGIFVIASASEDLVPEFTPALSVRGALVARLCQKQFADTKRLSRSEGEVLERYTTFAPVFNALKDENKIPQQTAWKDVAFAHPVPCAACEQGYQGVLGIYEVADRAGIVGLNLVEDALFKAAEGQTSIEEVLALVGDLEATAE